jgi:hypothetical protein
MGLQTATNPDTGETVVFDGKAWQKAEQTAGNDKGEKAYLVNGKWLSDATMPNSAPEEPKRVAATMAGVNRGISGLVGLPVDTAENIVNLGIAGIGTGATALGRPDLAPDLIHGTPGGSESVSGMLNKVGIGTTNPSPQDLASRLLYRGGVVAGGSMVPGARPLPTAASAVGGAVAGEALGEPYTAVGAMAPAAAVQAGQAAKTAIADRVQPRVESFKEVGAQPSVGRLPSSTSSRDSRTCFPSSPVGRASLDNSPRSSKSSSGPIPKQVSPLKMPAEQSKRACRASSVALSKLGKSWTTR